jgi:hypothetical protein
MIATRHRPGLLVAASVALTLASLSAAPAGDWQRDEVSVAWRADGQIVWKFSFDPKNGKPFFDPLGPAGGPRLTNFKPEDHPWHYGLWFSWKYINGANYWEENRATGRAEGLTSWQPPAIETQPDGRATISMNLTYTHPTGRVDLSETRQIAVSAPDATGTLTIDWRSRFVAGREGAVLGRTPMPGEPNGAFNGGYAGLGARLASAPFVMTLVSTEGPVTEFTRNRARPNAAAVAANFAENGIHAASIAMISDPANIAERAPWYLVNEPAMRFMDPAVLAPAVRTLAPGEAWVLTYRIILSKTEWTADSLRAAVAAWKR